MSFLILLTIVVVSVSYPNHHMIGQPIMALMPVKGDSAEITADDLIASLPQADTNWSSPAYDFILVLPPGQPDFVPIAKEYAAWKAEMGYTVLILDNYTSFAGRDGAEQLRNALIYYYQNYPIQWVLLAGDTDLIPIRYVFNPDTEIVNDHEVLGNQRVKPTDYYYADLTGDWNIDGDEYWGEDGQYNQLNGLPEVDFYPEVYVGRFPVETAAEFSALANKTVKYEQMAHVGGWMDKYLAISGISDPVGLADDRDGEDEGILSQYIIDNYIEGKMNWTHSLEHTSAYQPPDDPRVVSLSANYVENAINQGVSIIAYAGHGSPTSFSAQSALTSYSIAELANYNTSSFLYADACSTNGYDYDNTMGERFLLAEGGGIGYVGSMRLSWYYPNDTRLEQDNRGLLKLFMAQIFENHTSQQGKALYDSKVAYLESDWFQAVNATTNYQYFEMERKSLFSYMLLGDPSVDIHTAEPSNFSSLATSVEVPYIGAQSRIELRDTNGAPVPYGRVMLFNSVGENRTFTADENGVVEVQFPVGGASVHYRVLGHNMWPAEGNLTLLTDDDVPTMSAGPNFSSSSLRVGENVSAVAQFSDNTTPVREVYVFLSSDHFTSSAWQWAAMAPLGPLGQARNFSVLLTGLNVGEYSLAFVAFDATGNYVSTYPGQVYALTVQKSWLWGALSITTYSLMGAGLVAVGALTYIFLIRKPGQKEKVFELEITNQY